ncbi:hypothetical protein DFP72DRAFT_525512 [Ephemerocybe angulata]|uniref:Uncharacterized protein n=1 Tax=Ephemerocybe angulata TaxID=980116 RepID=A0A8H6MG48_9AGAR|nr:hypothetical protein DFP72DRAFT_525512 [Tulosesus angulatus]
MPPRFLSLRYLLALAFLALVVTVYVFYSLRPPYALYDNLFRSEILESQDLTRNPTSHKKYVKFRQLQGAGFNNQAQEILLFHHLALETGRTYVYQPFIWRPRGEKEKVPLSAFLRGPTRGSINEATFDEVCPESEVKHVKIRQSYDRQWEHAKAVLRSKDRCVVVDDWLFSWAYLASPGIHDIWPSYQKYLNKHFEWSSQVLGVVERTKTDLNLATNETSSYMALHLRRGKCNSPAPTTPFHHAIGDFETHCNWLRHEKTGFTTWATLPLLAHSTLYPSLDINDPDSVFDHCYPSLRRILDAVTLQAKDRPHTRRLHILHDGAWDHPLVYLQFYKLREALMSFQWTRKQRWKGGPMMQVTQSSDLPVQRGERDWKVCVDMDLAVKADAFVGNGYSSLSSQIVALRLALGQGTADDITLV